MPKDEYCPNCGKPLIKAKRGWVCSGNKCVVGSVKYVRGGTLLEPVMVKVVSYVTVL